MNKRDNIINRCFQLIGYCQGVMLGIELRLRAESISDEDLLLITNIQDEIRTKTNYLMKNHAEILDNE